MNIHVPLTVNLMKVAGSSQARILAYLAGDATPKGRGLWGSVIYHFEGSSEGILNVLKEIKI